MTEEEIEDHLAYHADEKVAQALSNTYGVDFTPQASEEEEWSMNLFIGLIWKEWLIHNFLIL